MQRKNVKNRIGNVIGNAIFRVHLLSFSIYCVKRRKTTIYCGLWRTHRESNPELTLRRGLFYPLNYECKLRILRKLINDMAFSKTLPIFYSVVKNARYLAFFWLKGPILPISAGYISPLGGPYYIHLTTEACEEIAKRFEKSKRCRVRQIDVRKAKRLLRFAARLACLGHKTL